MTRSDTQGHRLEDDHPESFLFSTSAAAAATAAVATTNKQKGRGTGQLQQRRRTTTTATTAHSMSSPPSSGAVAVGYDLPPPSGNSTVSSSSSSRLAPPLSGNNNIRYTAAATNKNNSVDEESADYRAWQDDDLQHRNSSSNNAAPSSSGSSRIHNGNKAMGYMELEQYLPLAINIVDENYEKQRSFSECLEKTYSSSTTSTNYVWAYHALHQWLFPPQIPRSCQLLRPENIAIPACYLMVGLLQGLLGPLVNVFPLDLGATEAQQTTVSSIRGLPSSFKLLFGFLSDTVPLFGYKRKSYMLIGWLFTSLSFFVLLMFSNTHIPPSDAGCFSGEGAEEVKQIPEDAPSIAFFSVALLGFGSGFWMADVMGDSVVAERAKLEPPEARGTLQSSCYAYRFFGKMVAAPFSTYLYATWGPFWVVSCLAVLPLTILPLVWIFVEQHNLPVRSVNDQCGEIWNTVCSRAVWQPMGFVYLYNIMQVSNAAWKEFLVSALHFTKCQLNLLLVTSLVLLWLGILTYKHCFIHMSWRKVYICTTTLCGFFSLMQLCLIYGITFGMSTFLFALGDDAFTEFVDGIQFLPTTIMMVHLCPVGSEGASYAMFTTVNNSALSLSSAVSTMLLRIWDVSKQALQNGQLNGMVRLTCLTTAIQMSAIFFVGLLPEFKSDLIAMKQDDQKSKWGGSIFLTITFLTLTYAITVGVLNIVKPGWMGES